MARLSVSRRKAKPSPHTPREIGDVVDGLMAAQTYHGFSRAQLTAAVSSCRALCPAIDIFVLRPGGTEDCETTVFCGSVPSEQAHALMGVASVPKPPKRINYDPPEPFSSIGRRADGFIHFDAEVPDDEQIAGLRHLGPSAIRSAVSDSPESERAWRSIVAQRLCSTLNFMDPGTVRTILCTPVRPSSMPRQDRAREAAYACANSRFYFRQEDVEHLVALYARRHAELQRELLAALAKIRVFGPGTAARMHLIVDNARPEVRS